MQLHKQQSSSGSDTASTWPETVCHPCRTRRSHDKNESTEYRRNGNEDTVSWQRQWSLLLKAATACSILFADEMLGQSAKIIQGPFGCRFTIAFAYTVDHCHDVLGLRTADDQVPRPWEGQEHTWFDFARVGRFVDPIDDVRAIKKANDLLIGLRHVMPVEQLVHRLKRI